MLVLQLILPILSLLVLAAHFLRGGHMALVVLAVALIAVMAVPRRWAARAVQAALVLGAAEWVRTLVVLARLRAAEDLPAARMVVILVAVAAVTAASALVFRTRRARGRYRRVPPDPELR